MTQAGEYHDLAEESQRWWGFATAGRLAFGRGASTLLPEVVENWAERILVVTDRNLVDSGIVDPLVNSLIDLPDPEVLVFDEGEAEVGFARAEACVEQVRDFEPTVVVAIGGGSNIDLGKVMAGRLTVEAPIATWTRVGTPRTALPVIAVPTTAGAGSEVTSVAVLTDDTNSVKTGFASPAFLPCAVLVDPLLAVSCPRSVTAHSGMDALSHAVESYLAISWDERPRRAYADPGFVGKNPISDVLALRAVELLGSHLKRAVDDGTDVEAREAMALGAMLAGMAFSNAGTGIVHALQYPLGVLTKTPHGLGNTTLMPAAVRSNLDVRQTEAAELARALGSATVDDHDAAHELPDRLGRLALSVGLTPNLRSIGVVESDLVDMAASASRISRLTENNPRPIDEAGLLAVLQDALDFAPAMTATV